MNSEIENVFNQLKIDEGFKSRIYYDTEGYMTVGYGRNLDSKGMRFEEMLILVSQNPDRKDRFPENVEVMDGSKLLVLLIKDMQEFGITRKEGEILLYNDIKDAVEDLNQYLPWYKTLPQDAQEVLINMCFNMGIGYPPKGKDPGRGLRSFHETLPLIQLGKYEDAAQNLEDSKWYRQTKTRAKRIVEKLKNLSK